MEIEESEFESCRKAVMADCSKKTHNWERKAHVAVLRMSRLGRHPFCSVRVLA